MVVFFVLFFGENCYFYPLCDFTFNLTEHPRSVKNGSNRLYSISNYTFTSKKRIIIRENKGGWKREKKKFSSIRRT